MIQFNFDVYTNGKLLCIPCPIVTTHFTPVISYIPGYTLHHFSIPPNWKIPALALGLRLIQTNLNRVGNRLTTKKQIRILTGPWTECNRSETMSFFGMCFFHGTKVEQIKLANGSCS